MKTVLLEIDLSRAQELFVHEEAGIASMQLTSMTAEFFQFGDWWASQSYNTATVDVTSLYVQRGAEYWYYAKMSSLADCRVQERSFYFEFTAQTVYIHFGDSVPWWLHDGIEVSSAVAMSNTGYHSGLKYYEPRLVSDGFTIEFEKDPLYAGMLKFKEYTFTLRNGDGELDLMAQADYYGSPCRVLVGKPGDAYSDFQMYFEGRVAAIPKVRFDEVEVTAQDKRKFLSRSIPIHRFTTAEFPGIEESDVGKPVPVVYGRCRNVPLVPLGSQVFKVCDPLDYGGIVAVDAVYVDGAAVTPTATDLSSCTVTVDAADANEYSRKVTADVQGYADGGSTLIENGLYVLRELMRLYADVEYIDSNYDTSEWSEQESAAQSIALFIGEDTELSDVIERICLSLFGVFYVKQDGRYTFRRTDEERGVAQIINGRYLIEEPEAEYDAENYLTSVTVGYDIDVDEDEFKRLVYDTKEAEIYLRYKQFRTKVYETLLKDQSDAQTIAEAIMALAEEIPTYFPIVLPMRSEMMFELLDNIVVDINRSTTKWYGRIKGEVIRTAVSLAREQIEYTVRFIREIQEGEAILMEDGSVISSEVGDPLMTED